MSIKSYLNGFETFGKLNERKGIIFYLNYNKGKLSKPKKLKTYEWNANTSRITPNINRSNLSLESTPEFNPYKNNALHRFKQPNSLSNSITDLLPPLIKNKK